MNSHHAHFPPQPAAPPSLATLPAFQYSHLGTMASVGEWKGVIDTQNIKELGKMGEGHAVTGVLAFVLWRAAYWTKQVSLVNKFLIPMYWLKSAVFGRDISRF
ncbi:hypothetical protein B484DRAFT_423740 [Ochromonadaceae sp. CCMP2298]|nr:hypothetical protein B484DRAFT_423740 [Ochromonadaceae sp. CCMP2298]